MRELSSFFFRVFGPSVGIVFESSRSAIIVSGVNRLTSKSRAEALLAALKISTTVPGHNSSDRMTPGSLPEWLQDILPRYESSAYFYVSHSWRTSFGRRVSSSPLYMKRDYQMAHDATTSTGIAGRYLTGMLPATGSRSFLHHDLNSSKYTTYSDGGCHLHNGAILHIPDGAITQEIYPNDTGYTDFAMNGAEHESAYSFSKATIEIQKADYVEEAIGHSCHVIFLPLLFIGDPTGDQPPFSGYTLTSTDSAPVVRGIVLASRRSNNKEQSMTVWSKAGLYWATQCRLKPLDWKDGILVCSASEEAAASRDKVRYNSCHDGDDGIDWHLILN